MSDMSPNDAASQANSHGQRQSLERQDPGTFALSIPLTQLGLEVAPPSENDMQSVNDIGQGDKVVINQEGNEVVQPDTPPVYQRSSGDRRLCGMRRKVLWISITASVLLSALRVGLGVGLTSQESDGATSTSSDTTASSTLDPSAMPTTAEDVRVGGSIDPSYYSKEGAWNGSGVAHFGHRLSEEWIDGTISDGHHSVVYFQNYLGEIQSVHKPFGGASPTEQTPWTRDSSELSLVASDARNSTPISGLSFGSNQTSSWDVFCESTQVLIVSTGNDALSKILLTTKSDIDSGNIIRQRSGNSGAGSTGWTEGLISSEKRLAWEGDMVGLKACSVHNGSLSASIRLFYASSSATIQEWIWFSDEDRWAPKQNWTGYSGASSVGCYTFDTSFEYVALVNTNNTVEFWYQKKEEGNWYEADWKRCQYTLTFSKTELTMVYLK